MLTYPLPSVWSGRGCGQASRRVADAGRVLKLLNRAPCARVHSSAARRRRRALSTSSTAAGSRRAPCRDRSARRRRREARARDDDDRDDAVDADDARFDVGRAVSVALVRVAVRRVVARVQGSGFRV
eukprot:30954-Pelagococcus_subviridis.AAC.1